MRDPDRWWSLPGPGRFVDSLLSDLRSGRNLVIALPEHHPPGLRNALGNSLRESGLLEFRELDLRGDDDADAARSPARYLQKRLAPLSELDVPPSARTIAAAPMLERSVLWIEGITQQTWPAWRRFLDEYRDACRMRREHERFLLVAPLVGTTAERPPNAELTLGVHRWEAVVGRIDMLLYTTALLDLAHLSPLLQDLALAVTIEVAGTDPLLVDRLARASIESLLEPERIVRDEAEQRGWRDLAGSSPAWHRGMVDRVNGQRRVHICAEVASGRSEAVGRRVWRGQVAVLFPFLEDHRLRFAQRYRHFLRVPIRTEYETITNIEALELTHLVYQLRGKIDARKLEALKDCLRIRNDLAHLHPLTASDLLSPTIAALAGSA